METAELRKQDRLRAEDKMIQREREREGDEFADKEAFVTEAYKKQQEELRIAEDEEKKREGACPRSPLSLYRVGADTLEALTQRPRRRSEAA